MFNIPAINNQLEALKIFLDIDDDSAIETIEDDSTMEIMKMVHFFKYKNDTYQVEHRSRKLKGICASINFNSGIYDIKIVIHC